jgi:hypothetical protein
MMLLLQPERLQPSANANAVTVIAPANSDGVAVVPRVSMAMVIEGVAVKAAALQIIDVLIPVDLPAAGDSFGVRLAGRFGAERVHVQKLGGG